MCASWLKEYRPDLLADMVNDIRHVDTNGKVSFNGLFFEGYLAVLKSAVTLNSKIDDESKTGFMRAAVFEAAKRSVTPSRLLAQITKQETAYLAMPLSSFVLSSTLSISHLPRRINIHDRNTRMTISPSPFSRIDRTKALERAKKSGVTLPSPLFAHVIVHVDARCSSEAVSLAIGTVDFCRAVWNLFLNHRTTMRISFGKKKPVNAIRFGPIHTLHRPDGKLVSEVFWYEPDYIEPSNPYDIKNDWSDLAKFLKSIRSQLNHNPHADRMRAALIRYTRALDERNLTNAFLKLWSLLEYLTLTENDRYDITIKRTLFFFQEQDFHRQILEHLRTHRNNAVHLAAYSDDEQTLVFQLKGYVERMLLFQIKRLHQFKDIEEFRMFLDSPADPRILGERISVLRMAKRFRTPRRP